MQTIENTREKDVTMIAPDDTEVDADDAQDEFAGDVLLSLNFQSHRASRRDYVPQAYRRLKTVPCLE